MVKLSDITQQVRGITYKKNDASNTYAPGRIKLLRAGNIIDTQIIEDDLVFIPKSLVKENQILQKGDVLIASSSGSISVVGKAAMINHATNATFGAFCKVLRLKTDLVNERYFKHFFGTQYYKTTIRSLAEGANINNLKNEHFDNLQIPLPPLPVQRRIAAILDAADEHRRKTQALIEKYDELAQSVFLEMFGDPVRNEKGWEVKKLSKLIKSLDTGVSVNSTNLPYSNDKIGILKTSCVYTGNFRPGEAKIIRTDEYDRMKLNPKKDSIIISRMNTNELVGKSAYVPQDYPNLYLPDRLWQTSKSEIDHNVKWLSVAISFKSFKDKVTRIASGTSGSMKNISKKNFLTLPIIYPPFELQNKYAGITQNIDIQKNILKKTLSNSETLFQSLLQRAFRGELVTEEEEVVE